MINYKKSEYQNNTEHGDDCYNIIEYDDKKSNIIVVLCDGVSSSTSGKIASFIATDVVSRFFKNPSEIISKEPSQLFYTIQKAIGKEFADFHKFLVVFKDSINTNKEVFEQDKNKRKRKSTAELNAASIMDKYLPILKLSIDDFTAQVSKMDLTSAQFWTTLNILWLSKLNENYWRAVCFNLGDGYLVQTNISPECKELEFKDIFFYRPLDTPPQFGSKRGIVGEPDFKILYLKKHKIISLGTDGTRIKILEYDKPIYQYEYFREYAEFLVKHSNDFENTAKLWFQYQNEKTPIKDDFTLVNIMLL